MVLPRPVERALRSLARDISTGRRMRQLSQENLAQRVGTSLSTIRRMEDGYPGTALHTFLRTLHVLGRLDALVEVMALEKDALGMELIREQLPQRVRRPQANKSVKKHLPANGPGAPDTDELEGF